MDLTNDQKDAVARGEAVPVLVESTDCIVIRADVFQRFRAAVDDALEPDQVGQLVDENMRDDDLGDPLLDSYQKY